MIVKARSQPTDALVLDLEDAVIPTEKATARRLVKEALPRLEVKDKLVFVRVNSFASGLAEDDLRAVVCPGLDGISLPKGESPADIEKLDRLLLSLERERGLPMGRLQVIPWIESARAVLDARLIAGASPRVVALAFGAEDFTIDMGIPRSQEGFEVLWARSQVAVAARAARVKALDTPYMNFRDNEGLLRETRLVRQLGFGGKFVIHPSQIETVHQVFVPTAAEVEEAKRIVAAFAEAAAKGMGAVALDGRVVDIPIVERARRLLALAEGLRTGEGEAEATEGKETP
ncbi:MAG: HpcH/HpaI aldolase/citrate lyase family protein [Chloroflexi bacterium]|nr:HpcH/HpaI aldolase/citrate lyase family protein [Chloroflexota bacterium]